jgi:nudix-type nucleoside diphosphatase (YffH/AdpP family)
MARIAHLKSLYTGWSRLFLARITLADGNEILREVEDHGAAAAVLPYDPHRRCALVIRQLRTGPLFAEAANPVLIEAPAGLIDAGEQPLDTARREALEEVGVDLKVLQSVGSYFAMPAVSSERLYLYLAEYKPDDRTAVGGGLASETESLEVIEPTLGKLWDLLQTGELTDLKTALLLLSLKTQRPELFKIDL